MRDIQHHLASTLSVELSAGTISKTRRRGLLTPPAGGSAARWTSSTQ
ncbi:hypothetical protein [Actinomyces naeslundii]|nr:hypothetical protein [Actinomyces naeslundii]